MATTTEPGAQMVTLAGNACLKNFDLYETKSKFYIVGTDKWGTKLRVLEIEKSERFELNIYEDNSAYSKDTWKDLHSHLQEKNKGREEPKHVTKCYGIIGFIKLTGPYYMWLITKKRKVGSVCGHKVYSIAKTEMLTLSTSARQSVLNSKEENRYQNLLRKVDLTKEFYFSYSYNLMNSFQRNIHCPETARSLYKSRFTWNRFLTGKFRKLVQNTWTVALIYGFFGQATHSVSLKKIKLILIARRSRCFAGTRYMRRGIDDNGNVANEVETEQIVYEVTDHDTPTEVTSVVQLRGSIPLFWSQQSGTIKPEICLDEEDFYITKKHFDDLKERYKDPVTILSLVKSSEKSKESMLNKEFLKAVNDYNNGSPEEEWLSFCHWDLKEQYRRQKKNVLSALARSIAELSKKIDVFYCQLVPNDLQQTLPHEVIGTKGYLATSVELQKGILRTNCIDCLDRTNVAQYVYGLVALGAQLKKLKLVNDPKIDLNNPLAKELMTMYVKMGDELAQQYGGSAAHTRIFSEVRGQWKATIQVFDIARKVQRFFNNTFMDPEKQDGINIFLGYFQPKECTTPLWKLDARDRRNIGRCLLLTMESTFPNEVIYGTSNGGALRTPKDSSSSHSSSQTMQQSEGNGHNRNRPHYTLNVEDEIVSKRPSEDNLNGSNFVATGLLLPYVASDQQNNPTERSSLDNQSPRLSNENVAAGSAGTATVVPFSETPDVNVEKHQPAPHTLGRLLINLLLVLKIQVRHNSLSVTKAD